MEISNSAFLLPLDGIENFEKDATIQNAAETGKNFLVLCRTYHNYGTMQPQCRLALIEPQVEWIDGVWQLFGKNIRVITTTPSYI